MHIVNSELLAPAGDLEKLKYALIYGADAVFIGGQEFSLRARASNFTIPMIKEAVKFAHSLGKKVYITTNIIPHNHDFKNLKNYLLKLEKAGVDAIICASYSIIQTAKKYTNLELHLSTQQSSLNSNTILFWKNLGIKRIVLGRELDIKAIKSLNRHNLDIEVFIHGGMCMSYSGRCSLSNTFTLRDANRGGCAHSCRWNYKLYNNKNKKLSDNTVSLSAKDLSAVNGLKDLLDIQVSSLKIEGRMKSLHYIATICKTYRKMIDEYILTKDINNLDKYYDQLQKAENRETSSGYLDGNMDTSKQLYNIDQSRPNQNFCGLVREKLEDNYYLVEERNRFSINDQIEIFSPDQDNLYFKVEKIIDQNGDFIETARKAKELVKVYIPYDISKYSILRKINEDEKEE